MDLLGRVAGVATSPHTGRALTAAKVLNFVGTVRGAVTTVLVLASAAGGAATVTNVVQQELAPVIERPAAVSAPPIAAPVTAASIRANALTILQKTLSTDTKAADELRRIAVLRGAPLDQLIADTKQQLQQRYDQGIALVSTLLQSPDQEVADPPPASVMVVVNALVAVTTDDLNRIVVRATQAASGRAAEATPARSAVPGGAVSPAVSMRTDVQSRLQGTLAADQRSVDDLASVATIPASRLAQLIVDTKAKLQARYDQGIRLLEALVVDPTSPPSASTVASLVQVITNDLNAITRQALQLATVQPTATIPPFVPQFVPPVVVPRTATPAPRTPSPAPRTASPAPRTPTIAPPTPTPAPRTATPPPATVRPSATH